MQGDARVVDRDQSFAVGAEDGRAVWSVKPIVNADRVEQLPAGAGVPDVDLAGVVVPLDRKDLAAVAAEGGVLQGQVLFQRQDSLPGGRVDHHGAVVQATT